MSYTLKEACEPFALPGDITCDCEGLTQSQLEEIIAQATDALVAVSGFTYRGVCTESFRPRGGEACGCVLAASCGCSSLRGFTVPSPVALDTAGDPAITVWIDGVEMDEWALVDGDFLIRTDGKQWPGCQNLGLADKALGTFVVDVTYGEEPSLIARNAVTEIACQFMKRNPNDSRRLPSNTTSASAQGVTITLETLQSEMKTRSFMLPWTVRFMTVYSPDARNQAFVYSPEIDDGFRLHQVR